MTCRRLALFVATALVAAALSPRAARAEGGDPALDAIYRSAAQARGDYGAWANDLAAAFASAPGSPAATEVLESLSMTLGYAADPAPLVARVEAAVAAGIKDGDVDERARDVLEARARAKGDFDGAEKAGAARGYVRRFAVIGPFGREGDLWVHRRYAPEDADIDLKAPLPGVAGKANWRAYEAMGVNAWISPREVCRKGGGGVFYGVARVRAAAGKTVALKVVSTDSFAVIVNGKEAIVADRERDYVPQVVWGAARLEAGWNRLLVKVAGGAAFAVKVADAATGLPADGIEVGDPMAGTERPEPTAAAEPRTYRTPCERAKDLVAAEPGASDPVLLSLAARLSEQADGLAWDAWSMHKKAVEKAAGGSGISTARVRSMAARQIGEFDAWPEVMGRVEARKLLKAAVEAFPGYAPARVRLAEEEEKDDHPDVAWKQLGALMEESPTASTAMAMARLAKNRAWEKEAVAAATKARALAPRLVEPIDFLEDYDRRFANGEGLAGSTALRLDVDAADSEAMGARLADWKGRGKFEEVLAYQNEQAKRYPPGWGWRAAAAQTLVEMKRWAEAADLWRALSQEVVEEASYPRELGEALEETGDKDGALAAYRESLVRAPYQPNLWRVVARLSGAPEDFAAPFEPDVKAILAGLPSTEALKAKYPKAVAVTVLDHSVQRVRPDGSSSSMVHMVYQVLDEKGVEKYGNLPNRGESYEVRAILPDGRVMLPTGLGSRDWNIEGLVPGTILEQRFLIHEGPDPRGFSGDRFTFQDSDFEDEPNPVLQSRFVLLTPEGMTLSPKRHLMDADPVVETKDGLTATIWERKDMPRIESEKLMPAADEIVPWVDYSLPPDRSEAVFEAFGSREDVRPTPVLSDAVKTVVKQGMTDRQALEALYQFVNDTVTGDADGRRGPTDTLLRKSGDRGRLFVALARTAGIPFRRGRAMPWDGEDMDLAKVGLAAYHAPFWWFEPRDSAPFAFTMGSRHSPFGLLPESIRGAAAMLVSERGGEIVRLPSGGPIFDQEVRFTVRLTSDPAKSLLSGRFVEPSAESYAAKQRTIDSTGDQRKKSAERRLSPYFASPTLVKHEYPRVEERGTPFELDVEATMDSYLQAQGKGFVVALGLPKTGMRGDYVDRPDRTYDVVAHQRADSFDEIRIDLAGAYEVVSVPEDHLASSKVGSYSLTYRVTGDSILVHREVHLRPGRYTPAEYKDLVSWCQAIDDAEDGKIELRKR